MRADRVLTWRFALYTLLGGVLLCWPAWVTGSLFYFNDTPSYLRGGDIILSMLDSRIDGLLGALGGSVDPGPAPGVPLQADGNPNFVRSFVYSVMAFGLVAAAGPLALSFVQAAMVTAMMLLLLRPNERQAPLPLAIGAVLLALLTPVSLYSSLLLPDIFAALVILHGIVLATRFDQIGPGARWLSTGLACLAVVAHYGHPPVALGIYLAILLTLVLRKRLTRAVLIGALLPLLVSPVANLTASSAALETTSVAPLRLPILLARSIGDGPALWYLRDACPDAQDLAFCRAFGAEIPDNPRALLWDADGIQKLSETEMQAIRDEEFTILWRAFRAYPLEQTEALFGNALHQLVIVGTFDVHVARDLNVAFDPIGQSEARGKGLIEAFHGLYKLVGLASLVLLALAVLVRRLRQGPVPRARATLWVLALGLIMNAAVFGGLSAPVDRYNTRVIWLITLFALLESWRLFQRPDKAQR